MLRSLHEGLEADNLLTSESKLFVSIMAGIQMKTLAGKLKTVAESPRIIRVHPNTPAMVGTGCSVISIGEGEFIQFSLLTCFNQKVGNLLQHTFFKLLGISPSIEV